MLQKLKRLPLVLELGSKLFNRKETQSAITNKELLNEL